ncbi:hypothetical protein LZK98_02400 [Sphingomonas cannabina]|uniref:hypothetical protein n=1 Tax=Sphingomonas cannabina TaxID=2899123 RepID=UPI001F3E822E|nr:hypothetical protein [Sphingomonas cannabina]UIJ45830.1 hypothetical protein LZK98_02400 [Sphingomonas cannabina]
MIDFIALVAAVAFALIMLYRLSAAAPAATRLAASVAGLAGGLFGIAHWHAIGDSRWLVGAGLVLAATVLGWIGASRLLRIAAAVLAVLGGLLIVIAFATGFQPIQPV